MYVSNILSQFSSGSLKSGPFMTGAFSNSFGYLSSAGENTFVNGSGINRKYR